MKSVKQGLTPNTLLRYKRNFIWSFRFCLIVLSLWTQACSGSPLYGLVIDQLGNPVSNAKVICGATTPIFLYTVSHSDCSTKTNSKGMFYVRDSAAHLTIYGVQGYESKQMSFRRHQQGGWFPSGSINSGPTTKEKPYILHVWKGDPAPLIHVDEYYRFERDSSVYSLSLTSGEKYPNEFLDDIQIQFVAEQGKEIKRADWKVIFRSKSGGMLESDEPFMYLAPEDGYQQKIIVEQHKDDPEFKSKVSKRYYLKSRSGKLYARLEMEITPFYNDYSLIYMRYWVNPNGSRNLMYDEMKRFQTTEDVYYEVGKKLFDMGEYDAAMSELLVAANHGDKRASTFIGHIYYRGLGIKKDIQTARKWYLHAVTSPDLRGARHYNDIAYFVKKKVIDEAAYMLGVMSQDGIGVSKNVEKAMAWFKDAGYRGTFALGEHYSKSTKKEDLVMSYCWLRNTEFFTKPSDSEKFGKLGNAEYYQRAIALRELVSKRLTSEEIKVGESMSFQCGPPAAHVEIVRP